LLNVNLNFIIEHTTEIKFLLLVPLDDRNIYQAHWAILKSPNMAFNGWAHRYKVNHQRKIDLQIFKKDWSYGNGNFYTMLKCMCGSQKWSVS
jgi:hypothetical protein